MRLSVLSYSFRGLLQDGKMDVFGYLETCKYRYGLGAADIWNGFLASTEETCLKKVRDALDERELVLADLCADKVHIWEDDPDARKKNHENALAHIKVTTVSSITPAGTNTPRWPFNWTGCGPCSTAGGPGRRADGLVTAPLVIYLAGRFHILRNNCYR